MEELELNKKLDGIWGEQEAIGNIVENTIYCRRELSRTWEEVKSMLRSMEI